MWLPRPGLLVVNALSPDSPPVRLVRRLGRYAPSGGTDELWLAKDCRGRLIRVAAGSFWRPAGVTS